MKQLNHLQAYLRSGAREAIKFSGALALIITFTQIPFYSMGQSTTVPLKRITLQDKAFESVLRDYVKQSKAKVIAVFVERYDGDYTYTLEDYGLFDSAKRNPTSIFGEWENCILLFYSGIESIISPTDSTAIALLQKYLRPILPDQFSEQITHKNGIIEDTAMIFDPIIWRFKVRAGKVLWLRKVQDYQSEKNLYIK